MKNREIIVIGPSETGLTSAVVNALEAKQYVPMVSQEIPYRISPRMAQLLAAPAIKPTFQKRGTNLTPKKKKRKN